ncbi:CDP-diacylglycerol---serine O-phosphatidyltransferase [Paxillus involutus ATCC 200175]|nr:CDP-diacylglycerol---serine O-phosphatidyltransferase [Paxillus involutus ATCC 200175]
MFAVAQRNATRQFATHRTLLRSFWNSRCRRNISTAQLHPSIRDLATSLALKQPCLPLASKDIHVLNEPSDFYSKLLEIIRRARRRIFLSSLYIGSSEHELLGALDAALHEHPDLHVYLTLDYNRSTRPGPSSPVLALLPLLRNHDRRVHVSLFRSPKLRGTMGRVVPPRFNEGWGTWHAKIYGSDDEVIVSGANLNKSYFTDRQDRYLHFKAQPRLADYCFSFLRTISGFSYSVFSSLGVDAPIIQWPDSSIDPSKIQSKAEQALLQLQASHVLSSISSNAVRDTAGDDDVFLFPIIQGGQFNIREEERTLSMLFNHLASQECRSESTPAMTLTSGYFGLYKPYQDLILKSSARCDVIAASPKANGFYGSRGLSGLIPEGYTLLEQRFMRAVQAAGRLPGIGNRCDNAVHLSEWERERWTYHAKGIWLSPSQDSHPVLTLFGSTNLNSRSANLDTELSFLLMTSSEALRQSLHREMCALRQWAVPWRGADRKVRWRTKAIVGLVDGML